jgi:uncharacterized protein (TIGR00251 family)
VSQDVVVGHGKAGARFDVRVVPRGSKDAIEGVRSGALVVRVTAPPVGGAANEAVVEMLAHAFRTAKRDIRVVGGQTARRKTIEIGGLDETACRARLSAILR